MSPSRFFALIALAVSALALGACGAPAPAEQVVAPAGATPASTIAATTPLARQGTPQAAATPTPEVEPGLATTPTPAAANVEVSPSEVAVGGVTLTLALQPARHMFDQASLANLDPGQQPPEKAKEQLKGSAVFAGMLRVTNNLDQSQSAPADSAQGIIRHVVAQVKAKATGQVIPYLDLSMDVLFDGRPTLFDQALVPMAAIDDNSSQLYYGNNIKFPRKGTYQIFVRMPRNPLLGQDQTPAAQFNLTIR